MRTRSLLLAALLVLPASAQALTLLHTSPEPDGVDLRVRVDEAPLHARSLEGNLTLEGQALPSEPRNVTAEREPWRGFENVTRLEASGQGWLLLEDRASALAVPVEASPEAVNGTTNGDGRPPEGEQAAGGGSSAPSDAGEDDMPAAGEAGSGPKQASAPARGTEAGEDGRAVDPTVVAFSLLAAGAFAVERFARRSPEDEGRP